MDIIRHCEPDFADLIAAVVMDDHAHVLVRPHPGITAKRLASAWKGASAHRLCGASGRTSPPWQREYFDRWMQSAEQVNACVKYIRGNPRRRWPRVEEYKWVHPSPLRRSPAAEGVDL